MKSQTFQAQPSIRLRPHTILIVEDEHETSDLLMAFFRQEMPYWVFAVADAAQALEAVKVIIPTLFILDYGLPGVNGLELHDLLHSITELLISAWATTPLGIMLKARIAVEGDTDSL